MTTTKVYETRDTVRTFANETEEEKETLNELASSILDYWTDGETPEMEQEDAESEEAAAFQSVSEIHLAVTEDSPLMEAIEEGSIQEEDIIYIPASEAFPTGLSIGYLGHDDVYEGDALSEYNEETCEVIHAVEATFVDLLDEDISYSAGGINKDQPVQYIWTPVLYGEELVSTLAYQPEYEEEEEEPATVSTASRARVTKVKARVLGEEKTATPSTPSIASRTERMASARSGGNNHFKVNFEETSKGGNLTFQADDIVLYDADNDLKTKEDQLRLNGSIGLENINPELGFEWKLSWDNLLPQQLKAVVNYDEAMNLSIDAGADVSLNEFRDKLRESLRQPENKQHYLIAELQGVDWNNMIVLASFGVNLGLNNARFNMQDIKNETASNPLQPMLIFMLIMDMDGNLSVKASFELDYRDTYKQGLNIQQEGYHGGLGSQEENRGDFNTKLLGYDINLYNHHDVTTAIKAQADGEANLEAGIGIGAGFMCMGIMPAMIKGTVGLEAEASGAMDFQWINQDGPSWETEGEASMRAYLKALALLKLKIKTDRWLPFVGNKEYEAFDKQFDIADITLLEEKWEPGMQELEYRDYTDYVSMSVDELKETGLNWTLLGKSPTPSQIGGYTVYHYVFYDGEEGIPLISDAIDQWYQLVDFDNLDPSTTIVVQATEYRYPDGSVEHYPNIVRCRAKKIIRGMTEETTLGDLFDMEDGLQVDVGMLYAIGEVSVTIWNRGGRDYFGDVFTYDILNDTIYYNGKSLNQPVLGLDTEALHQLVISQGWDTWTWDTETEKQEMLAKMEAAGPVVEDYLREQKLNAEVLATLDLIIG